MSVSHPFLNHLVYGSGCSYIPNSATAIVGSTSQFQNSIIFNGHWMSWPSSDPGVRTPIEICLSIFFKSWIRCWLWYHNHCDSKWTSLHVCWAVHVLCIYHVCNVWTQSIKILKKLYTRNTNVQKVIRPFLKKKCQKVVKCQNLTFLIFRTLKYYL